MIKHKMERNKQINSELKVLKSKIKELDNEKKMNNIYIFNNCEHKWVLAREYFQYDERPNKCIICNLVRN
jgi:hypothetical protein